MLQDIRDYDLAKQAVANGEELIPSHVTYAILDGQNPVKVWREYRGLTQKQLAGKCRLSKSYLSQIETGKRKGTAEVLALIAQHLDVSVDDLLTF